MVSPNSCPCPHPYPLSESLYQLLSQTSPENMHRNVAQYGLDPATRYPNLNLQAVTPNQVRPPGTPTRLPRSAPLLQVRPSLQACPVTAPLGEPYPRQPPSAMGGGVCVVSLP